MPLKSALVSFASWAVINMPRIHIRVEPVQEETGMISTAFSDHKQWMAAIAENDGHLVRQLLTDNSFDQLNFNFQPILAQELDTLTHIRRQYPGTGKAYLPNDAWCLAALNNARDALQVLKDFGFQTTEVNHQGNTFLHCIIAQSSLDGEEHEEIALSTVKLMKSLMSSEEYEKVLLTENEDGLRPLELASHLGTFALFRFLFDTEGVYKCKIRKYSMFSVEHFDITEYVTGKRYFKSPIYTMMLLDRSKINHRHLHVVFQSDPMKAWFTAIKYSNIPIVVVLAFLRFIHIASYFVSLFLLKPKFIRSIYALNYQLPSANFTTNFTTNHWDNVTNVTNQDMDDIILLAVLSYSILYSSSVLSFDMIYGLFQLSRQHKKKWNKRTVTGTKDLVVCTSTCSVTEGLVLTETLGINLQILFALLGEQNYEAFFQGYTQMIVLCAIVACGLNLLYYVQLIPSLSLYVVAVQRMLHKTVSFLTAFALFFFCYVFGLYIIDIEAGDLLDSTYGTFELMLNVGNYADASITEQMFQMSFVFIIVFLLLNMLIAIYVLTFECVYKERHILFTVQSLSVYLFVDPVASTLMGRLHQYLQRKYYVFEDGRVYVTRILKK